MIRNIYCVGRNYRLHAAELGNEVPNSPMIFMKPTHSAVTMDGGRISLPSRHGSIHYETELVIRIGGDYRPGIAAQDIIDAFAIGIDFTLRDVQDELKKKQHPWLKAKGFKASAPLTAFRPIAASRLHEEHFSLMLNGVEKQRGHIRDMIFDFQTLIDHIGQHYGLEADDVIFTGTPAGVGEVQHGDHMELYWGKERAGDCYIEVNGE